MRHVSGNRPYPEPRRAGSRWTTEWECRAPSSGTKFVEHDLFPIVPEFVPEHSRREQKMFPTMLCNTGGFVCFCGFGNIFVPEHSPRVPDFVPDSSPLEQKMFPIAGAPQGRITVDHGVRDVPGNPPLPMPHRAGSRRTTDCDMYLARTLTPCPVGSEQGAPRSARSTRKPFFPGVP